MDELSYDDVYQMYSHSVLNYKGKLVYVEDVYRNDDNKTCLKVYDLTTRLPKHVMFDRGEFKTPGRIGYVNHGKAAWFLSRTPGRMFKVGLTNQNVRIAPTGGFGKYYPSVRITSEGLQAAHDNEYPSLYKAWCAVKDEQEKAGAVKAFDHQFAICNSRFIYYKGKRVGSIPKGNVRKSNIVWNPGFEFLENVIEPDYEKTVRTFA